MFFSAFWDDLLAKYDVFHTPAPVSDWWATPRRDWLYMGKATWSEVRRDWVGRPVWGWTGVMMRRSWGV